MGEAIPHSREQCLERGKKQQAIALGQPGWLLRPIQKTIGVRRETISVYLRAAGIAMRPAQRTDRTGKTSQPER